MEVGVVKEGYFRLRKSYIKFTQKHWEREEANLRKMIVIGAVKCDTGLDCVER